MENKILEAVNEYDADFTFQSLDQARTQYSADELIDMYLRYEGIIGYFYPIKRAFEIFYELKEKE